MGDLVAAQFTENGPVAACPECGYDQWYLNLNGFQQRWDKITGSECGNCGFIIDWFYCEKNED